MKVAAGVFTLSSVLMWFTVVKQNNLGALVIAIIYTLAAIDSVWFCIHYWWLLRKERKERCSG